MCRLAGMEPPESAASAGSDAQASSSNSSSLDVGGGSPVGASALLRSTSGARLTQGWRGASASRGEAGKINWTTDANARLTRQMAARRRTLRENLRGARRHEAAVGDGGGGLDRDGAAAMRDQARREHAAAVLSDAREAYELLRLRGQLVAVTFDSPSLGLSLVLSKFARTPKVPSVRKRLGEPGELRRSSSSNDVTGEGDRLLDASGDDDDANAIRDEILKRLKVNDMEADESFASAARAWAAANGPKQP